MLGQVARPIEPHAAQERVLGEVTDCRHRQFQKGTQMRAVCILSSLGSGGFGAEGSNLGSTPQSPLQSTSCAVRSVCS